MSIIKAVKQFYKEKKKELIKTHVYQTLLKKYHYQKVKHYCPLDQVILTNLLTTNGRQDILDITFNNNDYAEDSTWQMGVCAALDIFQKQMPIYWLEKNWLRMMLETDLPKVIPLLTRTKY